MNAAEHGRNDLDGAAKTTDVLETSDVDAAAAIDDASAEVNPEVEISRDIAKRGALVAPLLIAVAGLIWGWDGVYSSAVAVGLVIFNFVWTGAAMAFAARISNGALMGSVLFGYIFRLGLILLVFLLVRDQSWFSAVPFGISIIVTHLGLLAWELRYVSLTMAYPGLKPNKSTL